MEKESAGYIHKLPINMNVDNNRIFGIDKYYGYYHNNNIHPSLNNKRQNMPLENGSIMNDSNDTSLLGEHALSKKKKYALDLERQIKHRNDLKRALRDKEVNEDLKFLQQNSFDYSLMREKSEAPTFNTESISRRRKYTLNGLNNINYQNNNNINDSNLYSPYNLHSKPYFNVKGKFYGMDNGFDSDPRNYEQRSFDQKSFEQKDFEKRGLEQRSFEQRGFEKDDMANNDTSLLLAYRNMKNPKQSPILTKEKEYTEQSTNAIYTQETLKNQHKKQEYKKALEEQIEQKKRLKLLEIEKHKEEELKEFSRINGNQIQGKDNKRTSSSIEDSKPKLDTIPSKLSRKNLKVSHDLFGKDTTVDASKQLMKSPNNPKKGSVLGANNNYSSNPRASADYKAVITGRENTSYSPIKNHNTDDMKVKNPSNIHDVDILSHIDTARMEILQNQRKFLNDLNMAAQKNLNEIRNYNNGQNRESSFDYGRIANQVDKLQLNVATMQIDPLKNYNHLAYYNRSPEIKPYSKGLWKHGMSDGKSSWILDDHSRVLEDQSRHIPLQNLLEFSPFDYLQQDIVHHKNGNIKQNYHEIAKANMNSNQSMVHNKSKLLEANKYPNQAYIQKTSNDDSYDDYNNGNNDMKQFNTPLKKQNLDRDLSILDRSYAIRTYKDDKDLEGLTKVNNANQVINPTATPSLNSIKKSNRKEATNNLNNNELENLNKQLEKNMQNQRDSLQNNKLPPLNKRDKLGLQNIEAQEQGNTQRSDDENNNMTKIKESNNKEKK